MERDGKVERFSRDQLLFSKGLKSLIKLHYTNDYSLPEEEWSWNSINQNLKEIIAELHGPNCTCQMTKGRLLVRYPSSPDKTNPSTSAVSYTYSVNAEQIKSFALMMKNLIHEVKSGYLVHLELMGVADELKTELTSIKKHQNELRRSTPLMNKAIIKTIRDGDSYGREEDNLYAANVSRARRLRIRATTKFGNTLLSVSKDGKTKRISPLKSTTIKTFRRLSFYILIHFHLAFDGFKRLKVCGCCGKLSFEEKKGRKKYCDSSCRGKFDIVTQQPERRLCREKQKAAFRNFMKDIEDRLNPVLKSECTGCNVVGLRSGECPIMLRRNKKELQKAREMRDIIGRRRD